MTIEDKSLQDLELKVAPDTATEADRLEQEIESDLPEKYRGKSVEDVVKMHQEAEKEKSRVANELGKTRKEAEDLRKLADQLLELEQVKSKEKDVKTPVTTDELFAEPDKAIDRAVSENESVKRANDVANKLEKQLLEQQFEKEFPDYKKDLTDPDFAEWVKASRARVRLIQAADQFNLEAAQDLWGMWKEHQELSDKQEQRNKEKDKRAQAEQDATFEGGSSNDSGQETVYDRQKLIDLRISAMRGDRKAQDKLKKFEGKLMNAYQERRVR